MPFSTKGNGFAGLDTELSFNSPVHIKHIQTLGKWSQEGKFKYLGRRNESGKNFRAGECMFFTESSAGYAGIKKEAKFDFGKNWKDYSKQSLNKEKFEIAKKSLVKLIGKKNFKKIEVDLLPGEAFILHHREGEVVAVDWIEAPAV